MRNFIYFYLNDKAYKISNIQHLSMMLSDFIRHQVNLTGTKIVCQEGDCGACSVLYYNTFNSKQKYLVPINSCIFPMGKLDGAILYTVEYLTCKNNEISEVQSQIVNHHGSQCGYCTPGFVIAISGLVEEKLSKNKNKISPQEAKNCMTGNLCRCTGYKPLIDATTQINLKKCESLLPNKKTFEDIKKVTNEELCIQTDEYILYSPKDLKSIHKTFKKKIKVVSGTTDLGVLHNKNKMDLNFILSLTRIDELNVLEVKNHIVKIGANVSLEEVRMFTKKLIPEFSEFLNLFASPQIKNVATLVGNVVNASPIADTPPFLLVCDASLNIFNGSKKRKVLLKDFYLDYKKVDLKPNEVVVSIEFKLKNNKSILKLYKISQRKDLDISALNCAFDLTLTKNKVGEIKISFGGVAPFPIRFNKIEAYLNGKEWTLKTIKSALKLIPTQCKPLSDLRGTSEFRNLMIQNLFFKFYQDSAKTHNLELSEFTL